MVLMLSIWLLDDDGIHFSLCATTKKPDIFYDDFLVLFANEGITAREYLVLLCEVDFFHFLVNEHLIFVFVLRFAMIQCF